MKLLSSHGPLPYRLMYGRLDFADTERWTWDWLVYPCIVVLEALCRVWPHQHNWYRYEPPDPEFCMYCKRPRA